MAVSTPKSDYLRGVAKGLPFLVMLVPFGLLFGVVARQSGLDIVQTLSFSALVIAGAAQFTAVQMMVNDAAIVIVLATALAVNLRMLMYSLSLVPHLGSAPLWQRALVAYLNFDQSYAVAIVEYEMRPEMSVAGRVGFFVGVATPIIPIWLLATFAGYTVGQTIPEALALDFVLPIMFLALVAPQLTGRPHMMAAGVAMTAAVLLHHLPSGLGLLIASGLGMMAGAAVEVRLERLREVTA